MKKLLIAFLASIVIIQIYSCSKSDSTTSSSTGPKNPADTAEQNAITRYLASQNWVDSGWTVDSTLYMKYAIIEQGSTSNVLTNYTSSSSAFTDGKVYLDSINISLKMWSTTTTDLTDTALYVVYTKTLVDTTVTSYKLPIADQIAQYIYPFLHYLLPKVGVGGRIRAVIPSAYLLSLSNYNVNLINSDGTIVLPKYTPGVVDFTFLERRTVQ